MPKMHVAIAVDAETLRRFDGIVGPRKRGPRIQELMEGFIEDHMNSEAKLVEPKNEEQLKSEE